MEPYNNILMNRKQRDVCFPHEEYRNSQMTCESTATELSLACVIFFLLKFTYQTIIEECLMVKLLLWAQGEWSSQGLLASAFTAGL